MVRFYKGNTLKGLTDRILAAIPKGDGAAHVVIVPDRFTLSIERKLASMGALLTVEVLPFSRFARRTLGPKAKECLTPEGCTMLLAKAIEGCRETLGYYRKAVDQEGFVNEMYSVLVALRNSGITADRLRVAAQGMNGRVADKTRDIATMMDAYLVSLITAYTDPTTLLEQLADAIPHTLSIANTSFYFVGFYCYNKLQYRVISQLMAYAKDVHLGYIAEDVGLDNARIFPADLRGNLLELARQKGVFCETIPAYEPLLPVGQTIQDHLFGYQDEADEVPAVVKEEAQVSIRLFGQPSLREELQTVCAEICSLLRQGYRYRDIAVISAVPDDIGDVLEEVFADYHIPVFRDRKVLLSKEPLIRFVLDGIACLRERFDRDRVMALVKNPLFGATADEVDFFDNYCRKYAINYSRFASPLTIQSDREDDHLPIVEKVRQALVASVPNFEGCVTAADYVAAIRSYQQALDLDARFEAFYHRQAEYSAFGADRSRQVPLKWRTLLDSFERLLGDQQVDLDAFWWLFRSALESIKISLLPSSLDQVYIGEAKDSHYDGVKVMFVVDAVDGKLPAIPEAGSILSESYYRSLQMGDVVVYPSAKDQGRYSRFYLEQLLLLPERLYVSCAAVDSSAALQRPSVVIESLSKMFHLPVTVGLGHDLIQRVSNRDNAYKVLLRERDNLAKEDVDALSAVLDAHAKARYVAVMTPVSEGLVHTEIFFRNELTSVSQLESYFGCPYRHFVKYGLGATERQEPKVEANETGNVIHKVLELLFDGLDVDAVDPASLDERIETCIDEAFAQSRLAALTGPEYASRIERLKGECRYIAKTEFGLVAKSKFRPMGTEIRFGGNHPTYPAIELTEGIRLKGVIDRVDTCTVTNPQGEQEQVVTVVDYKSGSEDPGLQHVYFGHKIQLYAYLGALRNKGFRPVGAFYKKVSGQFRRSDSKIPPMALEGQVVKDPAILMLLDPGLEEGGKGSVLPFAWDAKNGLQPVKDKDQIAVTQEQLDDLIDYVDALMKEAVTGIKEGYIQANPAFQSCEFCQAYGMCPMGKDTPKRKTNTVHIQTFQKNPADEEDAQ